MRIRIMISLIFLFTFLVLNVYSILEPNDVSIKTGESLADKLLNASNEGGVLELTNPKYPATPQQSQALHEKNLDWSPSYYSSNPESLSEHTTPQANRTEAQGQLSERPAGNAVAGSSVETQNTTAQIIPGQVTATVNWLKPCCYEKYGSFSPMITICNGMTETITGNATLTVSESEYQKSVVHGPFDCDSGCSDLKISWQIPPNAPPGTYDATVTIRPTASPYFNPIEIQKTSAFVVNPSGGVF